ncbi:ankyrin protein 3 [Fusarium bulbicola]|nr:ankyrin protein 3 [Fusarium bulbicola]
MPDGLYQSLLCQLQSKITKALEAMELTFRHRYIPLDTSDQLWKWKTPELRHYARSAFWKTLETYPIILFVDALDECGQESAKELADEFNSLLQRPSSDRLKEFRICFTCRHYPILNLDCTLEICIDKENAKDISLFVDNKLSSFQEQTGSKIADFVSKHAEGVFLWASLVVSRVLSLHQEQIGILKIESEVRQIPQTLAKLYGEVMKKVEQDSIDLIECICFAARPLTLLELYSAVSLADKEFESLLELEDVKDFRIHAVAMEWRIITLGHGLIEYKSTEGIVQFIHHTGTELLAISAHYRLTQTCFRYLEMIDAHLAANEDEWKEHKRYSKFPFLSYAINSWAFHADHIPDKLQESFPWPSNSFQERMDRLWYGQDKFNAWVPGERTLLHIASMNGWTGALKGILTRTDELGVKVELEVEDSQGNTPLSPAAKYGQVAVVKSLLEYGAQPDQRNLFGETPLHFAAQHGDVAIIELFLEVGAWQDAGDLNGCTPLSYALENGNLAPIELFLKRGARVDHNYTVERGHRFVTILSGELAYWKGVVYQFPFAVYTWMLNGPEVYRRIRKPKERWRTPLSHAAELGDEAAVRLLLKYNARPGDKDDGGKTPLSRAEKNKRKEVTQILRQSMGQG